MLAVLLYLCSALPSAAITLLRDPDIEHGLQQIAGPVLVAAGLSPKRVRVLVVNDDSFNAFVIDSQTIFLHYGLIMKVNRADMLQAVIAHEAAHITNGHLARRMGNMQHARGVANLGAALALIAAVAGASEAAVGIAAGTQSSAFRSFLKHTRAEESSADRSAAGFLRNAGINLQGMVDLHHAFRGQELLTVGQQDPYMQSHPLTRDRIRAAETFLATYGGSALPNPHADYWFARVRGKLSAFLRAPKWTMRRAPSEAASDIRLMREAVAYHRQRNLPRARAAIDGALEIRPDDPYYYELRGQIMMENREWDPALASYRKAVDLAPREPLILAGYGRALLATGRSREALEYLEKARQRDFRDGRMMRDLAVAYANLGENGMASMVTAERYALQGRLPDAELHAKRAVAQLPRGSAAWQRAQDVLIAAERLNKRKKK